MAAEPKFKGDAGYGYSSETDHLVEFNTNSKKKKRKCWCYGSVALLVVLLGVIAVGVGLGVGLNYGLKSSTSRMTTANLMKHLQDLEDIAYSSPQFSRAVQYAYNASADMIYDKLKDAGYEDVTKQNFTVATFEENSDGSSFTASVGLNNQSYTFNYIRSAQFSVMRYSQTTNGEKVTGSLSVVEESCNSENYTTDTIALIDYVIDELKAGCSLLNMTEAAAEAGALAVVMMRTEDDVNRNSPPNARIYKQEVDSFRVSPLPVLGVTYALGSQLKDFLNLTDTGTVEMGLSTDTIVNFWDTYNILAYTSVHQNEDSVIVVGSHLDSVPAGPGINDNGSGSAANLELALQIIKRGIEPFNKVLFAFWGAEELGLLGSTHFVSDLSEEERDKIALNLNYDMIGSPNYARQIYNGSGAENQQIVHASGKIQSLFEEYFESKGLNYSLTAFNGRSDYGPFIAEGVDIPGKNSGLFLLWRIDAGGLFTGADEVKSEEKRFLYGGLANAILDPCYHQACDTVQNVNQEVFLQMSQAAEYVLNVLMMEENLRDFLNS